jgi:hypothetical protein
VLLLLLACRSPDPVVPDEPIVVLWSVDTLGTTAAKQTGWCERIGEILAPYGRDVACPEGAVSPSSWTGEAHTRLLWPSHLQGELRSRVTPACGEPSLHGEIADATGAFVAWGADNRVLSALGDDCGESSWFQDADVAYGTIAAPDPWLVPEESRPVSRAIGDVLAETADGGAAVVFLNSVEVGGHFPRCFFAPDTAACEALWASAEEAGLAGGDPAETFYDRDWSDELTAWVAATDDEARFGPIYWDTMAESIEHHRGLRFDERLRRLLAGLEEQDRLDDLVLVAFGDHGEAPCVRKPVGDGHLICVHGGLPNEFTANVPVFVSPASLAERWEADDRIGDGDRPWALTNVAWGLTDAVGARAPSSWGEQGPVGSATSWSCKRQDQDTAADPATGLAIDGDSAVSCQGGECAAHTWSIPADPADRPDPLDAVPQALAGFADGAWSTSVCSAQ